MKNLETKLFPVLSNALQSASRPMGSAELFALPRIQAYAPNVSRLSAYLDRLWREGHLLRVFAPSVQIDGSTWAYTRKQGDAAFRPLAVRRSALITENDGQVTVEMPRLLISAPGKPPGFDYLEGLKKGLRE
ncbi:MAG: hypothetical protein IPH35_18055 [Rhodoferax sp.]|nr:hypothetical protein [Rhodoferax sp.]